MLPGSSGPDAKSPSLVTRDQTASIERQGLKCLEKEAVPSGVLRFEERLTLEKEVREASFQQLYLDAPSILPIVPPPVDYHKAFRRYQFDFYGSTAKERLNTNRSLSPNITFIDDTLNICVKLYTLSAIISNVGQDTV